MPTTSPTVGVNNATGYINQELEGEAEQKVFILRPHYINVTHGHKIRGDKLRDTAERALILEHSNV
jgi:hypothetical protein